ncbi:metallophosphoesterase family protein [Sphingomonas sp. H39-1-10]|jgi:serine/threonine protein phosphatase 1|nr:metallophosphoesterase family protein [Sphingomonas pollutisoli]MDF0490107.1 metallophosphoesterase family protein [Sphingomonas pollutisoli]
MIDVTLLPSPETTNADLVYAIGDVHGRLDLLDKMERAVAADIQAVKPSKPVICYLGDYIDRGPHSGQVIDRLSSPFEDDVSRVFLRGNHEDRMIDFLEAPRENGPGWMKYGGMDAFESYGLSVPEIHDDDDWLTLRDRLLEVLPASHQEFLQGLRLGLVWRDYLFVHAGVDPARPLSMQAPHDLMWIREPFLSSDQDWGMRVVHGHVIVDEPVFRANRIGIDTGAYKSGRLTCLAIDELGTRVIEAAE